MDAEQLRKLLDGALRSSDVCSEMGDVVGALETLGAPVWSIDVIFLFLEANGDEVFGLPGEPTHYLEHFSNEIYAPKLFDSLARRPSYTCLFMLKRLANSTSGAEQVRYVDLLRATLHHPQLSPYCRERLQEFL